MKYLFLNTATKAGNFGGAEGIARLVGDAAVTPTLLEKMEAGDYFRTPNEEGMVVCLGKPTTVENLQAKYDERLHG